MKRGFSILAQTVLLLVAAVGLTQIASILLLFAFPPPRPDFTPMSELVEHLKAPAQEAPDDLLFSQSATVPVRLHLKTVEDREFSAMLAERMGVDAKSVRVWIQPEKDRKPPLRIFDRHGGGRPNIRGVPIRRGEPVFVGSLQASWFDGTAWRTLATPPNTLFSDWQQRVLIWFMLMSLLLLPLAWLFARRLTRPIRALARAAERIGRDEAVESVPEQGPSELRLAGHALNRLQSRVDAHVRERTAMIGAIAHDLRTPLARIAFRMEGADPDVRDKVQADIAQMEAMIADTIAFVRGAEAPQRTDPLDIAALVRRITANARETGKDVDADVPLDPLMIQGDTVAVERLLTNLIDNAVKFGTQARIFVRSAGQGVAIDVADNGPGLPDDMLERVFDPFERGDPSRNRSTGGTGLGLAIARSIARGHGGTLDLVRNPEGGLIARLRL